MEHVVADKPVFVSENITRAEDCQKECQGSVPFSLTQKHKCLFTFTACTAPSMMKLEPMGNNGILQFWHSDAALCYCCVNERRFWRGWCSAYN